MTPKLVLTHMSGPQDGMSMEITVTGDPPAATLGRSVSCTLCLPDDPELSRSHARLILKDGHWWLENLGSSNGTFLGEFGEARRIAQAALLAFGSIFRVGRTRLRLECPERTADLQVQAARMSLE